MIGDPDHYLADGDYLNAARAFERTSRWEEAVEAYAKAGRYSEAGRLLESMNRFRDAGRMLLRGLPSTPTPVKQLSAQTRREAMKAALNFARGGSRNEAVGLLMNLGEHTRAASLLRMAGLRDHAVLAMRGKPIPGSPWPPGVLFGLDQPAATEAPTLTPFEPRTPQPQRAAPALRAPSRERPLTRASARSATGPLRQVTGPLRPDSEPLPELPPTPDPPAADHQSSYGDLALSLPGRPLTGPHRQDSLGGDEMSGFRPDVADTFSPEPSGGFQAPSPGMPGSGPPLEEAPAWRGRTFGEPGDGGVMPQDVPRRAPPPRPRRMSGPAATERTGPQLSLGGGGAKGSDPLAHTPSAPPSSSAPSIGGIEIREGAVLADRYRLIKLIGAGGMARVYRTMDEELEEEIALKIFLQIIYDEDEEGLKRFRQEMKLSRKLIHPNIVRIYEFGAWRGARFITMELLHGVDLETWVANNGGVLPPDEVLRLMIQACAGLHAAHTAGVIHRDVKPSNFFIVDGGKRLKLMDFGVAKVKGTGQSLSSQDARIGTPRYMSPEQIQGGVEVGPPADLYALGAVMYEILTGRRVFEEDELVPLLLSHLSEAPTPLRRHAPHVAPEIEAIVMRLLNKEPSRRFPDCNDLRKALLTAYVNVQRGG